MRLIILYNFYFYFFLSLMLYPTNNKGTQREPSVKALRSH